MARGNRRMKGDGFSLVDLNPTLTSVVSTLVDELSGQGVDIDSNALFMGIQNIVSNLASQSNMPGSMLASDFTKSNKKPLTPYSMTADYIAAAFERHKLAENKDHKREAVHMMLQAFEQDDAPNFIHALLIMNSNSLLAKQLEADDGDAKPDDSGDGDTSADEDEMSDGDIDAIIDNAADETDADDAEGDGDGDGSSDESSHATDENDDSQDDTLATSGGPMDPQTMTADALIKRASHAQRIIAAKLSSSGDPKDRRKALDILRGRPAA